MAVIEVGQYTGTGSPLVSSVTYLNKLLISEDAGILDTVSFWIQTNYGETVKAGTWNGAYTSANVTDFAELNGIHWGQCIFTGLDIEYAANDMIGACTGGSTFRYNGDSGNEIYSKDGDQFSNSDVNFTSAGSDIAVSLLGTGETVAAGGIPQILIN
jgi:hypothetical protein